MALGSIQGETLQERSKGKDVRTSNIIAAKVCAEIVCECSPSASNAINDVISLLSEGYYNSTTVAVLLGTVKCVVPVHCTLQE